MTMFEEIPPVTIVAWVTIFASTLDMLADVIFCCWSLLPRLLGLQEGNSFKTTTGHNAAIAYIIFTFVSIGIYVVEMWDALTTIKYEREHLMLARWAKSLLIALEEVPLLTCLYLILTYERQFEFAWLAMLLSCIKLVALTWGITKFVKINWFWFCLPCCMGHGFSENTRRCLTPTLGRLAMLLTNICHLVAIVITFININEYLNNRNTIYPANTTYVEAISF